MKKLVFEEEVMSSEGPEEVLYDSLFRGFIDAVSIGIWVSDKAGRVQFFNTTWLKFTGRTLEEELGHNWHGEEIHPDDRNACLTTYHTKFKEAAPFEHEYRLLRHDAEFRRIHEYVRPYFGKGRVHTGFVGTCLDITELKQ